jgi:hypothetical protein
LITFGTGLRGKIPDSLNTLFNGVSYLSQGCFISWSIPHSMGFYKMKIIVVGAGVDSGEKMLPPQV